MINPPKLLPIFLMWTLAQGSATAQTQAGVVSFTYDELGNVATIMRPLARQSSFVYDKLGRRTQENTTISGTVLATKFTYDGQGQVLSVTDPRSLITTYVKDGLQNTTNLSSPDTQQTDFTVNEAGGVTTSADARGKSSKFEYDKLGRLISIEYQSGTSSQFEYDGGPGGPAAEIGNLTRITDESGSTAFTHDLKGKVLTKTQVVNVGGASQQFIVQYSYGRIGPEIGKIESITYPSGARVNYRYDSSGRINSVTLNKSGAGGNSSEVSLLTDIAYTPSGAVRSWRWGASQLPEYQRAYDLDGRITAYPIDISGVVRTVNYDEAGMISAYVHDGGSNSAQFNQIFTYDGADRLVSFMRNGVTTAYNYDANGNRTQQTSPPVTFSYSSTSNRLLSASFAVPKTYAYDNAGNRISDGVNVYTYNDRGRLAQVRGGAVLDMFYNGFGQRVLKMTGGANIYYVYDEDRRTIGEYGQASLPEIETVYLGATPIAVITGQQHFYVLTDHIDTPLVVTDTSGTVVWDWRDRDPFGYGTPTASSVLPIYNQRLPGQINDVESGLFYNFHRDYDPQLGRYVQSDPIGLDGGVNTYSYVAANPVAATDPDGLQGIRIRIPAPGPGPGIIDPVTRQPWASVADDGEGRSRESRSRESSSTQNCLDDEQRCKRAEQEARSIYWNLTMKRIPHYVSGGTRGSDPGHYQGITQRQRGLRDAVRRVKLYCKPLPPELSEWERMANQSIPQLHK